MAAKAGKKGKKKGTTMALTDFLSDETGAPQGPGTSYVLSNKSMDWAAEMEELDIDSDPTYPVPTIDRAKLPTAPKAARGPEDLARVPKEPPFTAFIGNLPYEATEEKIKDFFRKLPVLNVRLPEDGGRLRGFGYVQFETRDALIDALSMTEESFGGRKVRIDLAGESQGENRKTGRRDDGQPDRTEGDWRRSESRPESNFNDRGSRGGFEERTPSKYEDREQGRYDDRGSSRYDDRRDDRGFGDRGSNRYEDRGPGRYDERRDDRGYNDRRDDRGYDDRRDDRGYDDRRDGQYDDRRDGRYDDRGGFGCRDDRGYGRDRYNDRRDDRYGGGSSGGGGGRDRYDDRRRFDDRDGGRRQFGTGFRRDDRDDRSWERSGGGGGGGGYRGDRGRGYGGDRGYDRDDRYDRHDRQEKEPEPPKERPRLHLQPRTKPVENDTKPQDDGAGTEQEKPKAASIFGSAKPVDTAQREREIEEKLLKQKTELSQPKKSNLESRYGSSQSYDEPKERERKYSHDNKENKSVPSSRRRSGSERSEDGDSRRERRSSGSSKAKKGSLSSQNRSRQDSGEQSSHSEVFSGGEEDKSYNAMSPAHREEPVKLVPAPLPKENIWEKRKSTQQTAQSPPQKTGESKPSPQESIQTASQNVQQSKSPPSSQNKGQSNKSNRTSSQSSTESTPSKSEAKKEFIPAEPPKENPWMKRKQEREQQMTTGGKKELGPAPVTTPQSVPNAWAGRGGGSSERGRGRGGRGGGSGRGRGETPKPKEKKEKPLPQSIDEMPKLEQKKNKDFSDGNKFAGLLDDDEGDFEEDES